MTKPKRRRTSSQRRTNELFDVVMDALNMVDASDNEAVITCAAACGYYLAHVEPRSEQLHAMRCAATIAYGTMARTLEEIEKEAGRAKQN